jgi:hypothetical protein
MVFASVADPDPVGSGHFLSGLDPDPGVNILPYLNLFGVWKSDKTLL